MNTVNNGVFLNTTEGTMLSWLLKVTFDHFW